MTTSVQRPSLHDSSAALISLNDACVIDTAVRAASVDGALEVCAGLGLCNDLIAVYRTDRGITVTMKHDRGDGL
jgi:hypothetical protein